MSGNQSVCSGHGLANALYVVHSLSLFVNIDLASLIIDNDVTFHVGVLQMFNLPFSPTSTQLFIALLVIGSG